MGYQRIMVAVDGSDTSRLAVQEAIQMAKSMRSNLQIINVVDENFISYCDIFTVYDQLISSCKEQGQNILNTMGELVRKSKITCECRLIELKLYEGRIAEKIAAEAEAWPADLLIIGTHGRRGFSHLFLGSVAEDIIRIASMPVLLVRGK
ncbi:universal stress protein [Legionella maioricensis]|uniref:Universal stress protein n=1 Tax=Legionella maioricensis TaxID=2896528 RepID=A0A9X2D204_9GAMM|nr:universal stress protein [Legionella maioricensis]MCL9684869.1 universal stress protein [Legionella maioricensis]MCL9688945.1 universal stress protein [Legionella maioricensis]